MADMYTPDLGFSSAFDDNETTKSLLGGFTSPVDAQALVPTPPNSPPQTGPSVTTPQTGSLRYAPSQAQPKVSGPAMIPGIATKPEDLAGASAQAQPSGRTLLMPLGGGLAGAPTKYSRVPLSTAGTPLSSSTSSPQPSDSRSRWDRILNSNPLPESPAPGLPAAAQASVVPDQLNMQTARDQDRLAYLKNSGSGISQIKNPIGRASATAGDIALRLFAPGIEPFIGGTEGRHQLLLGQQEGVVGNDQAQQQARAQLDDTQSQADERRAKMAQDLANAGKADRYDPNATKTITTADGVFGFNTQNGKYDLRLGDAPDKLTKYQVVTGGDGNLYRIDPSDPESAKPIKDPSGKPISGQRKTEVKQIEVNGKPHQILIDSGTGAKISDLGETGEKPTTVNVNAGTAALDRESTRFAKPWETANTAANAQLEKIEDARAMINGSAESQALGIPKVLTALVGGQGTGVRITTPELTAIARARGVQGDVEGFFNSLAGKGKLSSAQQQQLTQILDDVKRRITQKQQIANDTLDRVNGANSRDEVIAADKDARQRLSQLEQGTQQQNAGNGESPLRPGYIRVQLPGHPPGQIPAASKNAFLVKNKGARIIQEAPNAR